VTTTDPNTTPAYVHHLLDAFLTGQPLHFRRDPVPLDVQRRLEHAVASGQMGTVPTLEEAAAPTGPDRPYTDADVETAAAAIAHAWGYADLTALDAVPDMEGPRARVDARAVLDALAAAGRINPANGRPDVLRTVVRPRLVDLIGLIDAALTEPSCRCEDPEGRRWDHPHGTGRYCTPPVDDPADEGDPDTAERLAAGRQAATDLADELERTEDERDRLVDAIGRLTSMPARHVARAYSVRYGNLGTVAPGPDPQTVIDETTRRFFEADGSSERVEAVRDLLAGWYAAWPPSAVTDPHEPIAWQLESLITGAESRTALPTWVLDLVRGLDRYELEHPTLYRQNGDGTYSRWPCPEPLLALVPTEVRRLAEAAAAGPDAAPPPIKKFAYPLPVETRPCANCGTPVVFNLAAGVCRHVTEVDCTEPYPVQG
jgi:hypothetical protein